ncbi:CPBP family intramembrane glutamic endopeptidase [Mangrovibacterium lignilyticum]|uniref:CPBP family intramembrane glutamic endopeptidase n=1 Tax=Mangrovibacterium lignilyticum TaxID=2668052 RepID=UPI0013D6FF28|nr:type II CAAX endopeptidase family protein [Mangrovibacterium lignilyticum]
MQRHYPNLLQSIALFLQLILVMAIILLPYVIFRYITNNAGILSRFDSFYFYGSKITAQLLIIFYAFRKIRKTDSFSLKKELNVNFRSHWLFAILGAIALIFLMEPLEQFVPATSILQLHFANLTNQKFGSLLFIVILSPIMNETIFRGVILRGLLKNYKPVVSILLGSLIFALFHVSLLQAVIAFALSLFIGFIYWQTRSLALCILLHILNNGIAYTIIILAGEIKSTASLIDNTLLYLTFYLAAAMIFSTSLLQVYKKNELNL